MLGNLTASLRAFPHTYTVDKYLRRGGKKELVGLIDRESAQSWSDLFFDLKGRGLAMALPDTQDRNGTRSRRIARPIFYSSRLGA
jgi:hypothetical protein